MIKTARSCFALLLGAFLLTGCAGSNQIQSTSPSRTVYADSDLIEWVDHLIEYEDGRLRVGTMHDDDQIYVAIKTTNRGLIQSIMAGGLTLWFNNQGDESKGFGLKYPLGIRDVSEPGSGRGPASDRGGTDQARNDLLNKTQTEMDIIFEEGKPIRRNIEANGAFKASSSYDFGALSMELIIPRDAASGSDFFVAVPTDGTWGLGIETMDMSGLRGQAGQAGGGRGGRGGGRGGRGGRGGGGRGGGGAGPNAGGLSPINLWIQVSISPDLN